MTNVSNDQVRAALVEFISRHVAICFTAEVTDNSKAESEGLIEVIYNDMTFEPRIRAVSGATDKGERYVPAIGSQVFCVSEGNSDNSFVVVEKTELEKWRLGIDKVTAEVTPDGIHLAVGPASAGITEKAVTVTVGPTSAEITDQTIVFNGGELGGLIKIRELEKNLNSLKRYVEAINSALPPAFNAVGVSTSANGPLGGQTYQGSMAGQRIELVNMQNDKVKH